MHAGDLPSSGGAIRYETPFESAISPDDPDGALLFATYLFPELAEWLPVLRRLSVPPGEAASFAAAGRRNGTGFQAELLASGRVDEDDFYRALAAELGLDYLASIDSRQLVVSDRDAVTLLQRRTSHAPVRVAAEGGEAFFAVAPDRAEPARLRALASRYPGLHGRLKLAAPTTMRAALSARARPALIKSATSGLFDRFPAFSARIVANAWQGSFLGAALVAMVTALALFPAHSWTGMHFFFSFFFLACVGLRLAALLQRPPQRSALKSVDPADLPVYSVLVALYKETEIVAGLVEGLRAIVWPKAKLEIKLVCEADDHATLDALAACPLPRSIEIVKVPRLGPRTKPKALAYALPLVGGEFVALYDAEDRPNPLQLLHAWQAFRKAGPDLACVQAPLVISNRDSGPVALMFSFEYAALFRGLLPWLAARRLLLPLGGTSNHFRRSALDHVGGWDPHNVTEDADLGLRLCRFGFRTATIDCPTYEPAPPNLRVWLPQRTRWFKGWVQTWLVHMRNPLRLARDLGPGSFVVAQILFAGMVISALAHPFLVATAMVLAVELALARPMGLWKSALFVVDLANIGLGYLSFLMLGWQTLEKPERKDFWKVVLFTPPYWMMMSAAAWRAVWQLWRAPHLWEKTPHGAGPDGPAQTPRPALAMSTAPSALPR